MSVSRVRERLGRDDEEGLVRGEVARGLGEVGRVDVRDEAERHVAARVVAERLVRHHGPEVGPTDADVHDVLDGLAGVPLPVTRPHSVAERGHAVEHLVHLRHDVDPVDHQRRALRHPERDVQHRPVLGHVDALAGEHLLGVLAEPRLLGELDEQSQRLVSDPVLRVVEIEPDRLDSQSLAAPRIRGEQIAEMGACDLGVVLLERLPSQSVTQSCCHHATAALFCSIACIRSIHASTNERAPSDWSFAASAVRSTPAASNFLNSSSQLPPSGGSGSPASPWS